MKTEIVFTGRHFTLKRTEENGDTHIYFNIESVLDVANEVVKLDYKLYNYIRRKSYTRMVIQLANTLNDIIISKDIKGNIKFTGEILDSYKDGMFDWNRDLKWSVGIDMNGKKESLTFSVKKSGYQHIFTEMFTRKYNRLK